MVLIISLDFRAAKQKMCSVHLPTMFHCSFFINLCLLQVSPVEKGLLYCVMAIFNENMSLIERLNATGCLTALFTVV